MIEVLFLVVSALLVLACGAFVAAEFSLVTVDRSAVARAAARGDAGAAGVLRALGSLSTQLSGAQLGITLTNLLIGFLAEPTIANLIDSFHTQGRKADLGPVERGLGAGHGLLDRFLVELLEAGESAAAGTVGRAAGLADLVATVLRRGDKSHSG